MDHPSAILVGQIVVFTDDPELAVRAADEIRQANLAIQLPSGTVVVSGCPLAWTSLPALRRYDSWQ